MVYTVVSLERSDKLISFSNYNDYGYTYDVNDCLKLSEREALEFRGKHGFYFVKTVEEGKELLAKIRYNGVYFLLSKYKKLVIPLAVFNTCERIEVIQTLENMIF